jgi:hypothetical protein
VKVCGVLSDYVSCIASCSGGKSTHQLLPNIFSKKKDVFTQFEIDVVRGHTAADVYETGREILIICSLHTVCNNILIHY